MENRTLLSDNEANYLNRLTSDVAALKHFIDQLKLNSCADIKKLYIVLETNYQIELTGVFGTETSKTIFETLIKSRERRLMELEKKLIEIAGRVKTLQPSLANEV